MGIKGFETLVFYATQYEDSYRAKVGSGHGGCPSFMRLEDRVLVCGEIVEREGMTKNSNGLDVLSNDRGQSLTINRNEELVYLELGLFDTAAKARIEELMQKAGIVFTEEMELFFAPSSISRSQEVQLTV